MLLDRAVDEDKIQTIKQIITDEEKVNDYHFLKTRQAGNDVFVEVHLVFDCVISLMDAHRASDRIEEQISDIDKDVTWIINIHLDPYDDSLLHEENCSTIKS